MPSLVRRCAPFLLLLTACGAGGGGPAPIGVVDLGVVASTQPTVVSRSFANPFGVSASAALLDGTGGFGVQAGALPASVGAASALDVPVVFTPAGPGAFTGSVSVRFTSGASTRDVTESYRVSAENPLVRTVPTSLDFGTVAPATSVTRTTRIYNDSAISPVYFRNLQSPSPELTLGSPSLPFTIAPGAFADVTFRLQSVAGSAVSGVARLGLGDVGGPVDLAVAANLLVQEIVTDLGFVPFGAANTTAALQFTVPPDAVSFQIEAVGDSSEPLGLGSLTGPGGKVYENAASTGDYVWDYSTEVFTAQVPNTDRPTVQLVPGGGLYTFSIRRAWGTSSGANVRVIVERRPGATNPTGVLDLNVWLTQALPVSAASAASDARLQAVLTGIGTILAGQGITLGDIDYYDVTDPLLDSVTEGEFPSLLRLTTAAAESRLNLFFVTEAIGGNVVGVAGMIGGPKRNGTGASGVMSVYQGFSINIISLVAAHEIGHYLGLWHTVESTGQHDFIDDTLQCPSNGTNTACPVVGGGYLMHWQAVGGTTISNGQGSVIRGHPHLAPAGSGSSKLRAPPQPLVIDPLELATLPAAWCGTCSRCQARSKR